MNTRGYGGRKIREGINIKTNDPNLPWMTVVVTGQVENFAAIRPERVRLSGPAGRPLSAEVEIVPRRDYPFTISRVTAQNGKFIRCDLIERCTDGNNRCVIRVENTRKEKGRYVDAIYVRTDSQIQPTIPIQVIGMIQ